MLYLQWDFRKRPSHTAEITYQVSVRIADAYYAPPKAAAAAYRRLTGNQTIEGLCSPEVWLFIWTFALGATIHGILTIWKNMKAANKALQAIGAKARLQPER